ncbi:MAG TPA: CocE/NonD family hydrolase [Acetobacteraceae bacterium]|nr:CocE/NonD family hydrolase [Acetobacteraceae bacterium]
MHALRSYQFFARYGGLLFRRLRGPAAAFAVLGVLSFTSAFAQQNAQTAPLVPDIPSKFQEATQDADYVKREVMIPMRDGAKLHTVIVIPKGAHGAPIILSRTPYDASKRTARFDSPHMLATLPQGDDVLVEEGYIRVVQDVRGKYGSEGDYVMARPLRGPLNASAVDHSTDAWDTIDWLVKNVPESNGKVGMVGSSYEGFTVLMALVNPHPALKAAVPTNPMVDGWKGDDWFHNGAFRQSNLDYFHAQTTQKGRGGRVPRACYDDYTAFLDAGSAAGYARQSGIDQLPFWKKLSEHPAYDAYWQGQALDTAIAAQPLKVPTLFVASLWDQEDMYGAIAAYEAAEPQDTNNDTNFLALGPWRHSGVNYEGRGLGPLKFDGDTARQFRHDVMLPFLDERLKDGAPKANTPPVFAYETGSDTWRRLEAWPLSCDSGCAAKPKKLYLEPAFGLGFEAPTKTGVAYDEYVSDPAKPVPYQPRPVSFADGESWMRWLLMDQRFVDGRTDVLTYISAPLTAPLRIGGAPRVELYASTSGTDSDWVVKLIDVYPDEVPSQPELGGYELSIGMDIFRGRYRESLEHPSAIPVGKVQRYHFALPNANHVFLPGHRLMVQVQSSWFPLYDRNPQTYVPNIFFAAPQDYRKATQRVYHAGAQASSIELPVVPVN